ncbi:MAG: hypothetical protein OXH58_12215 [Acidimicrobiaceae bacterium]|nr:hypothetical protein [Acidimicrobiaceae bacterium]
MSDNRGELTMSQTPDAPAAWPAEHSETSSWLMRLVMTERFQIINAIAAVPLVAVCIAMLNGNYHPVAVAVLSWPLLIPIWVFGRKLTGRPVVRTRSQ